MGLASPIAQKVREQMEREKRVHFLRIASGTPELNKGTPQGYNLLAKHCIFHVQMRLSCIGDKEL